MSDDLLVGVFVPSELRGGSTTAPSPAAYLMVVDKRVSGDLGRVAARNVTLTLHRSVSAATVAKPGRQGARGFDELYAQHGTRRPSGGRRRSMYARVGAATQEQSDDDADHGDSHDKASTGGPLMITVELLGGGGAMVRLYASTSGAAVQAVHDASHAMISWSYELGDSSLAQLKAPQWAYDTWHARYRPYEDLELTAGRNFEDGEQTAFIIGGSFAGVDPPTAADEAKAWAWAGFNLLSMSAPSREDLSAYGPTSTAIGATLDYGYAFGFFGLVEPREGTNLLTPSDALAINSAFRCHGRWSGLLVGTNLSLDKRQLEGAFSAASSLRRSGHWLLPLASMTSAAAAIELGMRGVSFPMPSVPLFTASASHAPWAQGKTTAQETAAQLWAQAVANEYDPMHRMLASSYVPDAANPGKWVLKAPMAFSASIDACAAESDSMLRWSAFSALAYGARGIFWRGAGRCAPSGSPKFSLLASINRRIAQWGNTFVASKRRTDFPGGGYNITHLYATGYKLPGAVAPGSGGFSDLVQSADEDVLIAVLGSAGWPATLLVYVVDKRVMPEPGAARVRTLRVTLHPRVSATQPVEGDCAAAHCQCGLSVVGNVLEVRLPGGSGQLVALAT